MLQNMYRDVLDTVLQVRTIPENTGLLMAPHPGQKVHPNHRTVVHVFVAMDHMARQPKGLRAIFFCFSPTF